MSGSRARGLGPAPAGDVLQEQRQTAVEDRAGVPAWNLAAQQVAGALQLLVGLLSHRELHSVAVGSERGHDGARRRHRGCRGRCGGGPFRGSGRLGRARGGEGRSDGEVRCQPGRRELSDRVRDVREWRQTRDENLDLALSSARGLGQQPLVVVGREVRRDETQGAEVQGAVGEPVQDHRATTSDSGGFDPVVGGVLREPELLRAITEERPVALAQMELPGVEHGQVRDELDAGAAFPLSQEAQVPRQVRVRKRGGACEELRRHASHHPRGGASPGPNVGAGFACTCIRGTGTVGNHPGCRKES